MPALCGAPTGAIADRGPTNARVLMITGSAEEAEAFAAELRAQGVVTEVGAATGAGQTIRRSEG